MIYPGLKLGCTELANVCRTDALLGAGFGSSCWAKSGCKIKHCCQDDCSTEHLCGRAACLTGAEVYATDPADLPIGDDWEIVETTDGNYVAFPVLGPDDIRTAPWWNPQDERSESFLGLVIDTVELGTYAERNIASNTKDGYISPLRRRPLEITVEALMVLGDVCGCDYGIEWLNRQLLACADECGGVELSLPSCCGGTPRRWRNVYPTSSVENLGTEGMSDNCICRVRFTFAAQTPLAFTDTLCLPGLDGLSFGGCEPNWCKPDCSPPDPYPNCAPPVDILPTRVGNKPCFCAPLSVRTACLEVPYFKGAQYIEWSMASAEPLDNVTVALYEGYNRPCWGTCPGPVGRVDIAHKPAEWTLSKSIGTPAVLGRDGDKGGECAPGRYVSGGDLKLDCGAGWLCVAVDCDADLDGFIFAATVERAI